MQVQFTQQDLSVLEDSLRLYKHEDPLRKTLISEAYLALHNIEPGQLLELSALHLEAMLHAVTAYSTQVTVNRRDAVENTAATITGKLFGG